MNSGRHRGVTRIIIRFSPRLVWLLKIVKKYNLASIGCLKKKTLTNNYIYYVFATKGSIKQAAREFFIISRKRNRVYISYASLRLLLLRLGSSVLFLETSYGVISHYQALRLGIGGHILSCLPL